MLGKRPVTRVEEVVETVRGIVVQDSYRWLEDERDPAVGAWVAAQNAYARSVLDALPGRAGVAIRVRQALDVGSLGASEPRGRRRFFTQRRPGMEQAALWVSDDGGRPRLLVDPGPMSADGTTAIDWWTPSPDGELVCLGLSEAGTEEATLRPPVTADGWGMEGRLPWCRRSALPLQPGNRAVPSHPPPRPRAGAPRDAGYP